MTRLPGRPLSESWPELSPLQRHFVLRQLAAFTKQLSSVGTSSTGDENEDDGDETGPESWRTVGSLLARGDCQTFSQLEHTNDRAPHLDLELVPLLLPKRHGANNLRPVTSKVRQLLQLPLSLLTYYPQPQPLTTSALLLDDADDDDDYLSCYEVLLPTPSPPSTPIRARFFPAGSTETEIPTSAVVKSCEDWLAGIKSGMPEIVIIEVCCVASPPLIRIVTNAPISHLGTGQGFLHRTSSRRFGLRRRRPGRHVRFPRPMGPGPPFHLEFLRGDPILDTHEHHAATG